MIRTLLRMYWLGLKRERAALVLTFVLPILFFSVFSIVFGSMGGGGGGVTGGAAIRVAVVDLDGSEASVGLVKALGGNADVEIVAVEAGEDGVLDRDDARALVRSGGVGVALVIPAGFGKAFPDFAGVGPEIEVIYDAANPVARPAVVGLLQFAAFSAMPEMMVDTGLEALGDFLPGITEDQLAALSGIRERLGELEVPGREGGGVEGEEAGAGGFQMGGAVRVVETDARAGEVEGGDGAGGDEFSASSMVSYYAAGTGVMFLLFSMTGAAGSILDEDESGTLERLLASGVSMPMLLVSKWLFYAAMGVVQLVLMFGWGALVFGIDLFTVNHLVGFAVMTVVTACAASGLGLVLATLCRSRAQLGGLSTIVVLVMSAIGGSMMPRFMMPEFLKLAGYGTFNGWALEGFLRVFWYDVPGEGVWAMLVGIVWPVVVLSGLALVFMVMARQFARRWEVV